MAACRTRSWVKLTGRKGGHLLFHITRLTESGLVIKSESSGLYTLTEKGMGVMSMIRKLYSSWSGGQNYYFQLRSLIGE